MTLKQLIQLEFFEIVHIGSELDRELSKPYCCDLLSVAMGSAPANGVWVTVMGNINTLAVASLTDTACLILAQDMSLDSVALEKAKLEDITVLKTYLPIFDAALFVHKQLYDSSYL